MKQKKCDNQKKTIVPMEPIQCRKWITNLKRKYKNGYMRSTELEKSLPKGYYLPPGYSRKLREQEEIPLFKIGRSTFFYVECLEYFINLQLSQEKIQKEKQAFWERTMNLIKLSNNLEEKDHVKLSMLRDFFGVHETVFQDLINADRELYDLCHPRGKNYCGRGEKMIPKGRRPILVPLELIPGLVGDFYEEKK